MDRDAQQFIEDLEFILNHQDNWIFKPYRELARQLVMLYELRYGITNKKATTTNSDGLN